MSFKNVLHPLTNIRDAINAIKEDSVYPVTRLTDTYYMFNVDKAPIGNIVYTVFNKDKVAVTSYMARYGSYHTLHQVVANPIPRSEIDIVDHELPSFVDEVIDIGKIIKNYRDLDPES